jgi:hypothetical protein
MSDAKIKDWILTVLDKHQGARFTELHRESGLERKKVETALFDLMIDRYCTYYSYVAYGDYKISIAGLSFLKKGGYREQAGRRIEQGTRSRRQRRTTAIPGWVQAVAVVAIIVPLWQAAEVRETKADIARREKVIDSLKADIAKLDSLRERARVKP